MSIITVIPTTVVVVTTTTAGHVAAMIGSIGKSNLNAKRNVSHLSDVERVFRGDETK